MEIFKEATLMDMKSVQFRLGTKKNKKFKKEIKDKICVDIINELKNESYPFEIKIFYIGKERWKLAEYYVKNSSVEIYNRLQNGDFSEKVYKISKKSDIANFVSDLKYYHSIAFSNFQLAYCIRPLDMKYNNIWE